MTQSDEQLYQRKCIKDKKLKGIKLNKLDKIIIDDNHIKYSTVELQIDREKNNANIIIYAPKENPPCSEKELFNSAKMTF